MASTPYPVLLKLLDGLCSGQQYCVTCLRSGAERRLQPAHQYAAFLRGQRLGARADSLSPESRQCVVCVRVTRAALRLRRDSEAADNVRRALSDMRAERSLLTHLNNPAHLAPKVSPKRARWLSECERHARALRTNMNLNYSQILIVSTYGSNLRTFVHRNVNTLAAEEEFPAHTTDEEPSNEVLLVSDDDDDVIAVEAEQATEPPDNGDTTRQLNATNITDNILPQILKLASGNNTNPTANQALIVPVGNIPNASLSNSFIITPVVFGAPGANIQGVNIPSIAVPAVNLPVTNINVNIPPPINIDDLVRLSDGIAKGNHNDGAASVSADSNSMTSLQSLIDEKISQYILMQNNVTNAKVPNDESTSKRKNNITEYLNNRKVFKSEQSKFHVSSVRSGSSKSKVPAVKRETNMLSKLLTAKSERENVTIFKSDRSEVGIPGEPLGEGALPEKRPILKQQDTDWEDKIPMDVISFLESGGGSAPPGPLAVVDVRSISEPHLDDDVLYIG